MHKPHDVDGDQDGQERHPRDRDVISGEPEAVSLLERVSGGGGGGGRSVLVAMAAVSARLVLVVPLVARQLAAVLRWRRRWAESGGRGSHVNELGHVRQRKVVQRQICPTIRIDSVSRGEATCHPPTVDRLDAGIPAPPHSLPPRAIVNGSDKQMERPGNGIQYVCLCVQNETIFRLQIFGVIIIITWLVLE